MKSCHRAVRVDLGHSFVDLPSVDIVATKLSLQGRAFLIFCVYIPPLFNLARYQLLFDAFCSLRGFCESNTLIAGDFNISTFGSQFNLPNPCGAVLALRDFIDLFHLKQFNFISNSNERILDLVMSNIECRVEAAVDSLVDEDVHHPSLIISILNVVDLSYLDNSAERGNPYYWNFKKGNLIVLYHYLSLLD